MSLDKQKILNDLGSVMNQLQSAECGCMGKMFSNSGNAQNTGAPAFGCQQGCWGNQACGGRPCCGEPYSSNQQVMPMQGNHCMGNHCNPAKLYADTYGYLNQNLMQPVVKEVYDDLKSITPANTVMNNPMASQMGLGAQNTPVVRGNMGNVVGQNPMGDTMGGMPAGNAMATRPMSGQQQPSPIGEMGAQILNMMGSKSQPMNMAGQDGQQPSQGGDMMGAIQGQHAGNMQGMGGYEAQPAGAQYNPGNMGGNQAQYNAGNMGAQMQNPGAQYMTQPNTMARNMNQNPQMGNMPTHAGGQPMPAGQQGNYGMHSQGVTKFHEMFPGVMEGIEGNNLDFDPMSIAIQMNPANKQNATVKAMQDMLTGDHKKNRQLDANSAAMKPVMNGMNAVNANFAPNQGQPVPDNQIIPDQQQYAASPQTPAYQQQQQYAASPQTPAYQQQPYATSPQTLAYQQQQQYATSPQTPAYQQQQVVNPVLTEAPAYQEAPVEQLYQEPPPIQQSPRKPGLVNLPEGGYPYQPPPGYQQSRQLVKEPIFPVNTSKTQEFQYNTLGQPIETFPARSYHSTPAALPQTLSPQPIHTRLRNEPTRYSNVKSTVSKTSLFSNKAGGKTPSRSQLQHVYNQYKGSQSFTNQNLRNTVQQPTASGGRLNVQQANPAAQRQIPVERVGGDTIANNQVITEQVANKGGQDINQLGDGAANKPQGNVDPNGTGERPKSPLKSTKLRNGLQDLVYTSYPQSAAWSFHGHTDRRPYYPAALRYRKRV